MPLCGSVVLWHFCPEACSDRCFCVRCYWARHCCGGAQAVWARPHLWAHGNIQLPRRVCDQLGLAQLLVLRAALGGHDHCTQGRVPFCGCSSCWVEAVWLDLQPQEVSMLYLCKVHTDQHLSRCLLPELLAE